MAKKLILLGMAVAAVAAFAMPAVASAGELTLRDHDGKLEPGALVTGTSTNATTTNTRLGLLKCEKVTITAEVTENSGSSIKAKQAGGPAGNHADNCTASGLKLTVTAPTLTSLVTTGEDKGTVGLTFIADVGGFECHYAGTGGFTYETGTGKDTLHIGGVTLTAAAVCLLENEETGELINPTFHGDFTLETDEEPFDEVWVVNEK